MNDLVAKRTLTKNSIINFIGNIIPLFLAFLVIPYIIEYFGKERFAILTIIWAIVGYFSFLDFGLSRTLTKMVSEKLGANKTQEITRIVSTTFIALIFLGIFGTLILLLLAPWLIFEKFQISPYLRSETLRCIQIIAISIPFILLDASLKGILIAYQKFLFINIQRIVLGSVMFLSPLVISLFSQSLVPIIIILVLMRFIILLFLAQYSYKTLQSDLKRCEVRLSLLPKIFKFGGWLTITNVVGPIMSYFDRFLLGVWIPMITVTYYVSPHEFVTKLLILPASVMNVIFPAFSFIYQQSINKSLSLLNKSTKYIIAIMFPVTIFLVTFSFNILQLWLGPDFADNSTLIMQILLIGVYLNSIGYVYFSFIQGIGKPHITATSHMIQLPVYIIME